MFSNMSSQSKSEEKPLGMTFLEWKRQKINRDFGCGQQQGDQMRRQQMERGAACTPNIPSLLDIDFSGCPQRTCNSMGQRGNGPRNMVGSSRDRLYNPIFENNCFSTFEPYMPSLNQDDFFIPRQQPLQIQNISCPFNKSAAFRNNFGPFNNNNNNNSSNNNNNLFNNNNFFGRNQNNNQQTFQSNNNRRNNFNNFNNNNNNFNLLGRNRQQQQQNNNNNNNHNNNNNETNGKKTLQINNNKSGMKEPDKEEEINSQSIGPSLPAQEKKKKKNNWRPKPQEPPPLNFNGPVFISKEERKAQWKAYRDAMKPFKYKPFLNAKREIQRLGKRDRTTLSERELNRLVNAEEFVAEHKAYLSLKKGSKSMDTWVKADDKASEQGTSSDNLGEVYILKSTPIVETGEDNSGDNSNGSNKSLNDIETDEASQPTSPNDSDSNLKSSFEPGDALESN